MAQIAHVEVGDTPVDLSDGLAAGCYVGQARGAIDSLAVLYATAAAAPANDDDWFRARGDTFFTFTVGSGVGPTWCKVAVAGDTGSVSLALAS